MTEEATANESPEWLHIKSIPRKTKKIDFPRKDPATGDQVCGMLMRVLSVAELQDAALKAFVETQKRDDAKGLIVGSESWLDVFNNERALQLLFRACIRETDMWAFFPPPNMMRKSVTGEEVSRLVREYEILSKESAPFRYDVSDEEADVLIDEVIESNSLEALADCSWSAIGSVLLRACDRLSQVNA